MRAQDLVNPMYSKRPKLLSFVRFECNRVNVLTAVQDTRKNNLFGPAFGLDASLDYYAATVVSGLESNIRLGVSFIFALPKHGYVNRSCVGKKWLLFRKQDLRPLVPVPSNVTTGKCCQKAL